MNALKDRIALIKTPTFVNLDRLVIV